MTTLNTYGETFLKAMPQYQAYKKWFENAIDGSKFVYYRGCSLTETNVSFTLGKVILQDAYKGEVLLFQKRVSRGLFGYPFEYIAMRKRKAWRRAVPNKIIVADAV